MTSAYLAAHRPLYLIRNVTLGALTLVCLSGCLEDKKAKEENERVQKANKLLMKQLQDAQTLQAQQAEQLKTVQAEVTRLKAAAETPAKHTPAPASGAGTATPPPSPTGPAPKNLPYSLYTGIVSISGNYVELSSINFGLIDKIPLMINNGKVEVSMGKVKYLRRLGKFDEVKKTFPVSVTLLNGDEVRGTLPVEKVSGVDPRFGSKVEIPFATIIEIEIKH